MTGADMVVGTRAGRAASRAGTGQLETLVAKLAQEQRRATRSVNLTPSENVLSPLARVPFVLDSYSRYFFDHLSKFGAWSFFGALDSGGIEQEVALPLLREMTAAPYVTVQPISGLNCMTVALAALTEPGDTVVTVPVGSGGHISTAGVAARLGLRALSLPMSDVHDINEDAASAMLRRERPALIYLDQSSQLFPVDPAPLRRLIDGYSPNTRMHVDTSHTNGLVLGGALPNPLDRGADTFGGSTHKTLPGPHKGFLATRSAELWDRIEQMCGVLVSHHHPADVVSLAITLLEMRDHGGDHYAAQVMANARVLARQLHEAGVMVAAADRTFTACHQVWVEPATADDAVELTNRLFAAGLGVNRVALPGMAGSGLRLSSAEVTRLGATEDDMRTLATALSSAIVAGESQEALRGQIADLRRRLDRPRFCVDVRDIDGVVPEMARLLAAIDELICAHPSDGQGS